MNLEIGYLSDEYCIPEISLNSTSDFGFKYFKGYPA